MPAEKDKLLLLGKILHHCLVKYLSLWGQINTAGFSALFCRQGFPGNGTIGPVNRLCLHDHTGASAIWVVIHPVMFIIGKIPDIDCLQRYMFLLHGPADDAGIQPLPHHIRK